MVWASLDTSFMPHVLGGSFMALDHQLEPSAPKAGALSTGLHSRISKVLCDVSQILKHMLETTDFQLINLVQKLHI